MKCSNCGMELSTSSRRCIRCGKEVMQGFNYRNMEKELVNTVIEEEIMTDMPEKKVFYKKPAEEEPEEEPVKGKQWGKLGAALLVCAAVFAGAVFGLQSFSDEYVYGNTQAEYQNCLALMAQEDYAGALASAEALLKEDEENLEYLALKNIICQKTEDNEAQMEVLHQIIAADVDNYPAYEQLLQLYLQRDDNQAEIAKLAEDAPNSVIADMLKAYIVDAPYLELTPGVYDTSQQLEITSEDGHDIYYTLDGASPIEHGMRYSQPITLEQGHYTVKAVCCNESGIYGEEATGEYQIGISAENSMDTGSYTDAWSGQGDSIDSY